jgi:hypothetical protein
MGLRHIRVAEGDDIGLALHLELEHEHLPLCQPAASMGSNQALCDKDQARMCDAPRSWSTTTFPSVSLQHP